jgi:hypothetical protein
VVGPAVSAARFPACGRVEAGAGFPGAGAVYTALLIISRDIYIKILKFRVNFEKKNSVVNQNRGLAVYRQIDQFCKPCLGAMLNLSRHS